MLKKTSLLLIISMIFCSVALSAKSLTMLEERIIGESLYLRTPRTEPSLVMTENFFLYELNRICEASHTDLDFPITVKVIDSPQVNAFATAGSFIFIYTGILKLLPNVSEIMGVLCHELTHTQEHHIRRLVEHHSDLNHQKMMLLAALPLMILFPGGGEMLYGMAVDQTYLQQQKFSQQMEFEADAGAIDLMSQSGYDVSRLISAFETIGRYESLEHLPQYFSYYFTHPLTKDRISRIRYHQEHLGVYSINVFYPQFDYTLLQSELYPEYDASPYSFKEELILSQYHKAITAQDYLELLNLYPQSVTLRMKVLGALRDEKKWEAIVDFQKKYVSDRIWNHLPIVEEIVAECDSYFLGSKEFIRKYQNLLLDPYANPNALKSLAQAYQVQNMMGYYHLAQARYFLTQGAYQQALRELKSDQIDKESFYSQSLLAEAELKVKIVRNMM